MVTILVVEDETYARQSLVKQIERYNSFQQMGNDYPLGSEGESPLRILEAVNGEQGVEIYQKEEPEVVLTDIRMPRMDGLELLNHIKQHDPEAIVVMLSAYTDFEYARTALKRGAADYLLKPIEDERLKDCLDKCLNRRLTKKRETIMAGQDMATHYILQMIRSNSYQDFMGEKIFCKIFHRFQVMNIYFSGPMRINAEKILICIEKAFGDSLWTGFRLVQLANKIWTLVINVEKENSFAPRKVQRALTEAGYDSYIGVSEEYRQPSKIRDAYQEALHTLKYKILLEGRIFCERQLADKLLADFELSKVDETMLKEALQERNATRMRAVLTRVFQEIREKKAVKAECLELFFSQMLLMFRKVIQESGSREIKLRESNASILDFENLDDMEAFLVTIGVNICEMSRIPDKNQETKRSMPSEQFMKNTGHFMDAEYPIDAKGYAEAEQSGDVVAVMQAYVQEHYSQDITVKELAEKVLYMNPAYVSHVFSEKKGTSFSAWLRQVRMNHAKKFLNDSQFSITEVASMSGYNDTSQFIRVFKQETGMTPKKYRDSLHKASDADGA